jgi:hypothetical protein
VALGALVCAGILLLDPEKWRAKNSELDQDQAQKIEKLRG